MTIVERLRATGMRRLGTPKSGFRYRTARGTRPAAADLARIRALRIPPAWRDVAIAVDPRAAVQAVGRDARDRWQYLYHERRVAQRERDKQERLMRFIQALPRMRRRVRNDLARPGIPRERVLAGALAILSTCFLRPGSEDYVAENGSFGIATLRRRHVAVRGDRVAFDFVGKAGKRHAREIRHAPLARLVRQLLEHPGEVFKYRDGDGRLRDVRRQHINAYIQEVMGERFSAKDFRTWAANLLCASALARPGAPLEGGARARKRRITAAIREVADHLGNTPAVCRASYVFDVVLTCFERGRLVRTPLGAVASLDRVPPGVVERAERALLELLARAA
jgi:DNA topoisomerase-1